MQQNTNFRVPGRGARPRRKGACVAQAKVKAKAKAIVRPKAKAKTKPVVQWRPGRPRDASRERAILKHTLNILGQKGYSGLTVDEVVARAKVSKATIYRRWATKEELAVAAFNCLPELEIEEKGDLVEEFLDLFEQYNDYLHTTPLRSVLPALVAEAAHTPVLNERLMEIVQRRREPGRNIIRRAIERGDLPKSVGVDFANELLVGPLISRSFFDPDNIHREEFRPMVELIFFALKKHKR